MAVAAGIDGQEQVEVLSEVAGGRSAAPDHHGLRLSGWVSRGREGTSLGLGGQSRTMAETLDVRVPMEFKRRGGRKEIVLPPDAYTTPDVGHLCRPDDSW
ncbi:MAG: hypothetical protein WBF17_18675 [Phycisphaerae bacterium]